MAGTSVEEETELDHQMYEAGWGLDPREEQKETWMNENCVGTTLVEEKECSCADATPRMVYLEAVEQGGL